MLFSSRKNDELLLVLDIQSRLVRAALVFKSGHGRSVSRSLDTEHKPRIIYTKSYELSFEENIPSSRLIGSTVKAIKTAIDETLRYLVANRQAAKNDAKGIMIELPRKIRAVHYVLSSPWILSEAKRMEVTFPGKKVVTRDMIMEIIGGERRKMEEDMNVREQTVTVEEKIFGVELNGYTIAEWQGKSADDLAVSFVTSISGTKMVGRLKDVCNHVVRGHDVHFHSSLLLQYIGLGQIYPEKMSYTIVHIHGEITDIVVVMKNTCVFFGTYPIGAETILRSFAKENNMAFKTADSRLNLHSSGVTEQRVTQNNGGMDKAYELWISQFDKLIRHALFGGVASPLEPTRGVGENLSPKAGVNKISSDVSFQNGVTNSFIVSAITRQDDFVKILAKKYPNTRVETVSIDDVVAHVDFEASGERLVTAGLYATALHCLE